MIVRRRFEFEAAHRLPDHPGKCRELHGHSYVLYVEVERALDESSGMVIDFSDLKSIVKDGVVNRLDHVYVNDLIENPTAERMAMWIWGELEPNLAGLREIELQETSNCSVIYR
ncbi:MAG: 6-carboxytetrahydropterin synthase QueD, partial [Acidobacteria bacterium]|nr:6-carboxytetrahydropterin synthase QueD [Acidobacteriota bacterium]NIM63127.1 6-carboxytetrahydropterin synthase QueD [Acidobacteriota bacterium]NIO59637.1 6-carboxytetrahydropterin synthase QueD [Acidobacteriota bacterium]NIQ30734.1 6-carboxytetrahydropterin synthase QueD [Acidobacteriota bacterium]NIQ85732.1 6-carboxytetrahydropterin synthase QueD [Acidobacteriota bacterium]